MNLTLIAIALAVSAALGAGGSYWATSNYYENKIFKIEKESQDKVDAANRTALNAANSYEKWKATHKPKTITITRKVESATKEDVGCSKLAIPVSLRDALIEAGANSNKSLAPDPMPSASAAGTYNLGRPSDGLFRRITGAK